MDENSDSSMSLPASVPIITSQADDHPTPMATISDSSEISIISPTDANPTGSNSIAGVETNVESRFVDYTLATPWEQLCADIERSIKAWGLVPNPFVGSASVATAPPASQNIFNIGSSGVASSKKEIEIEYQGERYRLIYVERIDSAGRERSNSSSSSINTHAFLMGSGSSVHQLMHWLGGLQSCLLIAPVQSAVPISSLSMTSSSTRRVIFSALVCAMDSCRCQLPGLVASTSIDTLHRAREVLGYAICPPSLPVQRPDRSVSFQADSTLNHNESSYNCSNDKLSDSSKLVSGGRTVHFESGLLEGVAPKQELYYADGLLHMFSSKLHGFSNGNLTVACGSSFVQVSFLAPEPLV
jgi:hypothetical protein